MNHRLLVIHSSHCVEVEFDQQLTIGRDVYNSLCLQDSEVSRSHAIIFEQDHRMLIKDLRSRNGVYVNGDKVQEQALSPGDELILGATVMLIDPSDAVDLEQALSKRGRQLVEKRAHHPPARVQQPTVFACAEMDAAINRLLTMGDGSTTFVSLPNMVRLLQAFKSMGESGDARELFDCALIWALKIVGGHRGVIMESDMAKEHLKVRAMRARDDSQTILLSEPVLRILLEKEQCVYCPDTRLDERFALIAEQAGRPLSSFAAAPILCAGQLFGFIYLDAEDDSVRYQYSSLRALYLLASHIGALLRQRPSHFAHAGKPVTAQAAVSEMARAVPSDIARPTDPGE